MSDKKMNDKKYMSDEKYVNTLWEAREIGSDIEGFPVGVSGCFTIFICY